MIINIIIVSGPDRRELVRPTPLIATIRVPAATERDDGDYTCLATSAAGSLEEAFVVRVNRGDSFPDNGVGELHASFVCSPVVFIPLLRHFKLTSKKIGTKFNYMY